MKLDATVLYSNDIEVITKFYQVTIGLELGYRQDNNFVSFKFNNGVNLSIKKAVEKRDAGLAMSRLKASKKMKGVNEIYYPGEQSHKLRQGNLKASTIDVSDKLLKQIRELL
jgi:hypothetical protein